MEYKLITTREEIDSIIPKLIQQELYQYKHWRLYEWYTKKSNEILKVSFATIDELIIGVGIETLPHELDGINIAVYVKDFFRRKGIGSNLVKLLNVKDKVVYNVGYRKKFWNKL